MKALLERYTAIVAWLGGLGIPLAIVVVGWLVSTSSESSKLDTEYVRIALQILNSGEKDGDKKSIPLTGDEQALRELAVRLLNQKSPEKFTEAEQKALLAARKPFGRPLSDELGSTSLPWILVDSLRQKESAPAAERPASGARK